MSTNVNNWTHFTKRITINTAAEDIFRAISTKEGIERWFLRSADFHSTDSGELREENESIQAGDKYSWFWFGWSDEINQKGEILDVKKNESVKFTFHEPMEVLMTIKNEEGENVVELKQVNIATDDDSKTNYFVGCGEGWTFYLANLKSILEGGIDLRNKNEKIVSVVNS